MAYKIEWAPTPNMTKGRGGKKIIAIVNHITAGNYPGCVSWMRNPEAKASAQYLVNRAGKIYQLVKDEDTSWHAGVVNKPNWPLYDGINPNRYTIGIEHEGFDGELTEAQYQATLWLHKHLIAKHGIKVDKDRIIGHYRIDSVNRPNCPGPKFPWARLFADLSAPVKIQVGGEAIDGVILEDGRSYAPVRAFGEALGEVVHYDAKEGVSVGGVKVDVRMLGDRSYAPVRYLAETLGRGVHYDEATRLITVK